MKKNGSTYYLAIIDVINTLLALLFVFYFSLIILINVVDDTLYCYVTLVTILVIFSIRVLTWCETQVGQI